MIFAVIFGFGFVSGLRALTAITTISWLARLGRLPLSGTWLAFLGYTYTPWIFTVAALGELINDKLPNTPSRKVPPQFAVRVIFGALCGAAVGLPIGSAIVGSILGAAGAVAGTLLGAAARGRLVKAIGGRDLPIALAEDVVAVGLALFLSQVVT